MAVKTLNVVADRGYYEGEELRACDETGITVTAESTRRSVA
jgi:hypothetical protein